MSTGGLTQPRDRSWLRPLYGNDEMRALDRWAIDTKQVPSLELMERAGEAVANAVSGLSPDGPVRIVCGKGNNGGDGIVATRHLRAGGIDAEALLLGEPDELSPDARAKLELLGSEGWRTIAAGDLPAALEHSAVLVDGLLGTGFSGEPRPPVSEAIEAINAGAAPVVAIDVPSGVDASSGEVAGVAVRARLTVALEQPKVGLWVHPGKGCAGRVEVAGIGIPSVDPDAPPAPAIGLIGSGVLELPPQRRPTGNKFESGSVLVVGGSRGLTGAACLAASAALRAGAGWVRVAVPESLNDVFEVKLTEVMSVPLADRDGQLAEQAVEAVLEAAERADAVAFGPGLGRSDGAFALARAVLERLPRALLVDADGLNALAAAGIELIAPRADPTILTPHTGELARLLGRGSASVDAARLASAREAAERAQAVVVLKGDDTIVADGRSGETAINPGGSPGLATAGTGDVLTGVIAALVARGLSAFEAACAGVRAHAGAGRMAAEHGGPDSVIAGDVIDALPSALRRTA